MASERERLREWLLRETQTRDFLDLWPDVIAARAELLRAIAVFPEDLAKKRPGTGRGEGTWCAEEVARHAVQYTANVVAIIEATASGQAAPKDPPGSQSPLEGTFADLRRTLALESLRFASLPQRLPPSPNLDVTVPHAFFGELNCRGWFLFLRVHDGDHTRQLAALREAAG